MVSFWGSQGNRTWLALKRIEAKKKYDAHGINQPLIKKS